MPSAGDWLCMLVVRSPQFSATPVTAPPRHAPQTACTYATAGTTTMSDSASQPPDTKMEVTDDLDQSVENEINQDATQADAMNLDGANDDAPTANGLPDAAATFEQRIPAKKDATLREFLGKMDEYAPIVSATAIGGVDHTADADLDT